MFVKELEITLENGMKISGELDLPERQGQWKTIILFHGSGPSDRHATVESMGGIVSRNFDLLSEGFVKARYAVFRYDKRENYDIEIIIRDAREVRDLFLAFLKGKEFCFMDGVKEYEFVQL